ncbi:hypothetical protein HNR22_003719 [Micromonospora jinlongensis]|uniref:Transposase Helix-turn-helix domain-containing protein n=1 Tax=Micromonospora jinlongensis TaxID=1287877 RepID=A0A7Z0BG28_9ACTN|nr:hypothetical protein [Micromonospora jinlongensis]
MLSCPATIPLSSRTLNHLAVRIRSHRNQRRSRWRHLEPGQQALLTLAHLCIGDPYTRLAAGFEIGVATAWRYVQEAIALLSSAADDLDTAMRRIRLLAVHDPGRHPDPDRPGRGPEAVLLRKT